MVASDLIERLESREAELESQIRDLQAKASEIRAHLIAARAAEDALREDPRKYLFFLPEAPQTVELLDRALKEHPGSTVMQLIEIIRGYGWRGSGDIDKDVRNISGNLAGKPKRFRRLKRGVYERVEPTNDDLI